MPRGVLIFALCLPLAILMGFMLSDPMMGSNQMFISAALMALLIPLLLSIHHRALIWVGGAVIIAFFVKGQPQMWMVVAGVSFLISVVSRPLAKARPKPVWERWVLTTLILVMVSVMITAAATGGIGMRVFGSSTFGGRKYIALIASFIGFLALTMAVLPRRFAQRDVGIFTLGPVTTGFSNLAYMLGPGFYFLFALFPVSLAVNQAQADFSPALVGIKRYTGFGSASTAICLYFLMRWGFRGVCDVSKPWRLLLMTTAMFMGMLSGFRSSLLVTILVGTIQFFAEGLHRTKYAVSFFGFFAAAFVFLALFSESLPLAAQRSISFLPVKVDPIAAVDAKSSLNWRFEMWRTVVKEIPKHLWIGKGYAIDPTDLYLAEESFRRGFINDYETAIAAADYHSGFLSMIVPFGVVGTLAFVLFFMAGARVMYRNMHYGDADVRNINVFLFSFYVGRLLYFFAFFGGIETDFWFFVSLVGISLSMNGGMKGPAVKPQMQFELRRGRSREETAALAPI
ncbi:MAG TPA: O-antigen ligase family protein [Verrucomicrobiae bacterium]|nr:O-antigen ligase family protein [Verrucomicrobiae bacterium]